MPTERDFRDGRLRNQFHFLDRCTTAERSTPAWSVENRTAPTLTMSKKKIVVALLMALGSTAFAAPHSWRLFRSSIGFFVSYPGTWVRSGVSTDRLQIRNSKGGAEGVSIKPGQAEITVMDARESSKQTLAQVSAYYTQDAKVVSQKDVPGETVVNGCSNLKEIISKETAIPPRDSPISVPRVINTDLFCEVAGHKIVILLRNWEGDKRQREYQQVALQMARSIRMTSRQDVR